MNPKHERHGQEPALYTLEQWASPQECAHVLSLIRSEPLLVRHGVDTHRGEHGSSWELPVEADPLLGELARRALEAAGLPEGELTHLRLRRYAPGQGHPPHLDDYEIQGRRLVATLLLGLEQAPQGGATSFPSASPAPQSFRLAPGQALLWFNLRRDGAPDAAALHQGEPVLEGSRSILAAFIYAPVEALAAHPLVLEGAARQHQGRLYVLVDNTPESMIQQLRRACERRGVECALIDAGRFDMVDIEPLEPGAMFYRPATSHRSYVIEQLLVHQEVVTFYPDALGPHLILDNQALFLTRMGIPTPRAFYSLETRRAELRRQVEALGGLPVILKVPGRSLGVGVMRLDSWPALYSVAEAIAAERGQNATLMSCVEPAEHWRVLVVGDAVAAAYLNQAVEEDFRTWVDEEDQEAFLRPAPPEVLQVAVQATEAVGVEFGGVDVLWHPSGRAYVLEVNFPCYFGHPWDAARIDVAGVMVDHLLGKARALRP